MFDVYTAAMPINRKERYYTGTVLPMIICKDNFRYLHRFIELINPAERIDVISEKGKTNIVFYTEYNLYESLAAVNPDEVRKSGIGRNMPDILIYIDSPEKILIAIEAKLFDNEDKMSIMKQMNDQVPVIKYISRKNMISKVYHLALLPQKLTEGFGSILFPYITWESVIHTYDRVYDYDYFLEVLKIAVNSYSKLVSKGGWSTSGSNAQSKFTGEYIFQNFDSIGIKRVGRGLGLNGKLFAEDIRTGHWKTQQYEVGYDHNLPNQNWFFINDFISSISSTSRYQ